MKSEDKPAKVSGSIIDECKPAEEPKPERKKYNVFEQFPAMRRRGPAPKKIKGKFVHLSKAVITTSEGTRKYTKTYIKPTEKEKEEIRKLAEDAEKKEQVAKDATGGK